MLLKRSILNQKTTPSVSLEDSPVSSSVCGNENNENHAHPNQKQEPKRSRGSGSYVIRRKKAKRIEISSDSPVKQMLSERVRLNSESDSGSFDGLTWGSPTKQRGEQSSKESPLFVPVMRRQFSVENELHSLRVISKNRQQEADMKQSATSFSTSLCHDTNSSVSFTDTDISLTQQMYSIQEQSTSCPLPDIPLPPLLPTESKIAPINFLSVGLPQREPDKEPSSCQASHASSPTPPSVPLPPVLVASSQSQVLRCQSPSKPLSLASSQQLHPPVLHSQPSRPSSQLTEDAVDALLDNSVLEEADRIEAEVAQSQVLDDQDLLKVVEGEEWVRGSRVELDL